MAPTQPAKADVNQQAVVVTKALIRAADKLDINNTKLASIIGVSGPTVGRMRSGAYLLEPGKKEFELGVLFVRLFRSLDAIVSGDEDVARSWLRNRNLALGKTPLELIQTIAGLTNVIGYLDARRAVT